MPKNGHSSTAKPQQLIGAAEAAQILHMDLRTIHRQIDKGEIPHVAKLPGLRGAYVLDRAEIERIAAERAA